MVVRVFKRDVAVHVLDLVRDLENLKQFHFIKLFIVISLNLTRLAEDALCGCCDRDFERFDEHGLIHAFFAANLSNDFTQFQIHG